MSSRHQNYLMIGFTLMGVIFSPHVSAAEKLHQSIKVSLKYSMITGGTTVMDKLKMAADAGFAGVEPNGPLPAAEVEQFQRLPKQPACWFRAWYALKADAQ